MWPGRLLMSGDGLEAFLPIGTANVTAQPRGLRTLVLMIIDRLCAFAMPNGTVMFYGTVDD